MNPVKEIQNRRQRKIILQMASIPFSSTYKSKYIVFSYGNNLLYLLQLSELQVIIPSLIFKRHDQWQFISSSHTVTYYQHPLSPSPSLHPTQKGLTLSFATDFIHKCEPPVSRAQKYGERISQAFNAIQFVFNRAESAPPIGQHTHTHTRRAC